jgi:hypothetical protein
MFRDTAMTAPIDYLSLSRPRHFLSDGIEITCLLFDALNVSVGKGNNVPSCASFRRGRSVRNLIYITPKDLA